MKLGLLSDTHGDVGRTGIALATLQVAEPDALIHCGDIGSAAVLKLLLNHGENYSLPVYPVLGNVDLYNSGLQELWQQMAGDHGTLLGRCVEHEFGGKRVAVLHGDEWSRYQWLARSGDFAYVLSGHSHVPHDEWLNGTRLLNPGAVSRTPSPSVAILDLDRDAFVLLPLAR